MDGTAVEPSRTFLSITAEGVLNTLPWNVNSTRQAPPRRLGRVSAALRFLIQVFAE